MIFINVFVGGKDNGNVFIWHVNRCGFVLCLSPFCQVFFVSILIPVRAFFWAISKDHKDVVAHLVAMPGEFVPSVRKKSSDSN